MDIHGRVERLSKSNAYNAIENHKKGILEKLSSKLINPWKCEIRKFAQNTLEKVDETAIESTKLICRKIQI